MAQQVVKLTEVQLRGMVEKMIRESIEDGEIDEGRLGNFFSSLGGGAKEWWRNGGVDAFRQGYNQTMAQKSQADADAAAQQAKDFRNKSFAGAYKNVPGADKISAKYDGKINKARQEIKNLQGQVKNLQSQKQAELQKARSDYQAQMGKQADKFNKQAGEYGSKAANAGAKAKDMQNRRRGSLGLDPIQEAVRAAIKNVLK